MIKSEMHIERDFYTFVLASPLADELRGEVYRSEMRPANADTEDLIIKFLAGTDGQIQSGIVVLNLYVPDITHGADGRKVADKSRIAELQDLLISFVSQCGGTEYLLETDGTPSTSWNEDIEQHLIVCRIKFQRLTY